MRSKKDKHQRLNNSDLMHEDNQESSLGEIWVNQFTEESAHKFREQVLKLALRDPTLPIIVYIDSYGGYVHSLAKMIDTLDQLANPIITVCMGKAMSCGAILLSHGHYRYCAPNSTVMIHEVSSGTFGDVHDIHNDTLETKRLNEHFLGLLARNCGIKTGYKGLRKFIKERDGRDLYLDPHAAMEFGIVDEVGTPAIVQKLFYETLTIEPSPRAEQVKRAKQILGVR